MAIRFVIGRAGTGKTHHCLASVRRWLCDSPVAGERLILIVPEQASLQTERALLDHPEVGATHRAEVLSFRRLAHRILQQSGSTGRQALSTHGRAMVLRHLLGELRDRLTFYRSVDRAGGFVEQLGRSISELIEESVSPDDLEWPVAADVPNPLLAHKLGDLRLLYAAYLSYLGADKLDPSQYLDLAREQIARCDWLHGARIWVDGFAGFTQQQRLMLVALAAVASEMEVTALIDPEYARQAGDLDRIEPTELFATIQRMYVETWRVCVEAGLEVAPPLYLSPKLPPRFAERPALTELERTLWNAEPRTSHTPSDAVTLVRASDRRAEADYVASVICQMIEDGDGELRYRDVAIILRDMESYHDLLSAALAQRSIPFFLDRRRPTSHHPAVELLRGLVALAVDSFSLETVRLLLKTGLIGLSDEDADELENYLLARGIAGEGVWRQEDDWALGETVPAREVHERTADTAQRRAARINRSRRSFLERVCKWFDAMRREPTRTGRQWAQLLVETLNELQVCEHVSDWSIQAEGDGDLDLAEQHRQIVRDLSAFFDDLCVAVGDVPMDVQHLGEVLNAGLSQLTLGLAPPMLDQVLVGSIERSRHPEIKVAIVVGFNEGGWPHTGAEDSILNDDDRNALAERGVRLAIGRRQRVLEEPLLAYTALTRASRKVVITYAAADEEGKALRASPFLAAVRDACPGLAERSVDDGFRSGDTFTVRSSRDLAARLAFEIRNRPPLDMDDRGRRTRWNDIYEASRRADGLEHVLRRALASLIYSNDASIAADAVARLIREPFSASVSRLETFAACPFKHFAHYGLRLEERKLAALADVDVGKIHHAILEQFVRRVVEQRKSLGEMDDADVRSFLESSRDAVTGQLADAGMVTARDSYVLRRSTAELSRVLNAQRRVAKSGRFRPRGAEVEFGFDSPNSLPALQITTPAGRRVLLRGFIDRVDLAELADEMLGVVIDYKRTRDKRLDLSEVYHGISLQLLAYLLVLAERGQSLGGRPIQPVGAFFVSLVEGYENVDHPDDADTTREPGARAFRPRGVVDARHMDSLDESGASGWSSNYTVFRKKDGSIGNIERSDAADETGFASLLEHTRRKLGELADRVVGGDVAISPYRLGAFSPCAWCKFQSVCRIEPGVTRMRYLEKLTRLEVFERVADPVKQGRG